MTIKSFVISAIILFVWACLWEVFTACPANAMTSRPPLVKPWITQQLTTDWVRDITEEETNKFRQIEGNFELEAALNRWDRVWSTQKVISSSDKPSKDALYNAQAECNNYEGALDIDIWNVDNFFATPNEFRAKGKGDCEDYAICKYYALRAAGFKASQLNVWSGVVVATGIEHAVLAVELDGKEFILDNYYPKIVKAKDYMNRYFQPRHRANENGFTFF